MEGISFPSACLAEVPGKILFYQPQSGRARGSQELNPSLSPLWAEQVPTGRGGQPKAEDHSKELGLCSSRMGTGNCQEEQGAETLSLVESKHILENSMQDCDGSGVQRESSETLE